LAEEGAAVAARYKLPGKVYLTGAGPGTAKLLTLRALEVLEQADVVLHDDLVSADVLERIPARAAVCNVGKRCGQKKISQESIQERMIEAAQSGLTVVRLKGGDPLIFGRTKEEILALREAGIEFEIVPGITAATAAAAAAQIALTDRKSASKLVFVSNHGCKEKMERDWHKSVAEDATLVFYMPGGDFTELTAELKKNGLGEETACLLISNAMRPEQKVIRTSVGGLTSAPTMRAPSLLIVGVVAAEAQGEYCEISSGTAQGYPGPTMEEIRLDLSEQQEITAN
jgi:uroporphyrin-III C-methyltransferase